MGDKSKIEWTDATWNPVTGCTKVSNGCKHCYAERLFPRAYPGRKFTDVVCHADRLTQPSKWKRPRMVFVNSMSDLFHASVPDEFIQRVFQQMFLAPQHTFQVLTKRPERMRTLVNGWLDEWDGDAAPAKNIWLGVSVEDQATADNRIPKLLDTRAAVRFVSCEPLLGPIDLNEHLFYDDGPACCDGGTPESPCGCHGAHQILARDPGLDWVIVGGESGPGARPSHPNWFRSLRKECINVGVPYFFKQWGEWIPKLPCGGEPTIFMRADGGIYQESAAFFNSVPDDAICMTRVGRKSAGNELDGEVWEQIPNR